MKMTELLRYDIPPEIIRLWQESESDRLLPVQELAIKRHNLFGRGNLLIQAPTSSGKTFVGEMAAIQTALRRKKVVYLVPLKALAEEKYEDFKNKYSSYGLKVIVSTRDHKHFDGDLESGNFSIALVVYEKLSQLLVRRPEKFKEIELIVADELELLSDPERGPSVEILLTGILQSGCRTIGMSAVLGEANKLANWMGAEAVQFDRRPLELRYGVLNDGIFRYRTYNEYSEGEEKLASTCPDASAWEILMENTGVFAAQDEPCLIFVKTKHESRKGAELLAEHVSLSAAEHAIEKLRDLGDTHSRDKLLATLNNGVAFHNADLSPEERIIVEEGFRSGEIKVMVSTSTLAIGMNMPAHNVFITTEKWQYDKRFCMPWKAPILRSEYENMGGRAGRYGSRMRFGRSILIAPTQFDHEALWRRYVEGKRESIEPQLGKVPLEDHVLRLVASRVCDTDESLQLFLEETLTGRWIWRETISFEEMEFRVRASINKAVDAGMLARKSDKQIKTTPFGQAVASRGISIATAKELAAWIRESETRYWTALDLLLAVALTPDARGPYLSLTTREYEHADYPGQLKRRTIDENISANVPINRIRNCDFAPFFEEIRAIKAALLMSEWIDEGDVYELEKKYMVFSGQILATANQLAWLIDATAAIAAAFGAQDVFIKELSRYAEKVAKGLSEELLPVSRLDPPKIDRNTLLALKAHNLHTDSALANAKESKIAALTDKKTARLLISWAKTLQTNEEITPDKKSGEFQAALLIDDRHPGQIILDGQAVQLQEKQYLMLKTLAQSPGECVPYDQIYTEVWGDSIVESNQLHFQKRKILERISTQLPGRQKLIRTIPKRGFVLELPVDEVMLGV